MNLSYKSQAKDIILNGLRNIRYANCDSQFGFDNTITMELELDLDVKHISLQADVFARQILSQKSKFDLKRFLGRRDDEWERLLHEAYIYDRLRCVYYGITDCNTYRLPSNTYSFVGHTFLMHSLSKRNFQFSSGDEENTYTLYVRIKNKNIQEIFKPIFEVFPDIEEGISYDPGVVSYVNAHYETVLNGLYNAKKYLDKLNEGISKERLADIFSYEMIELNSNSIEQFFTDDSNPIINSFLGRTKTEFFFIIPQASSTFNALKFKESTFISRALGFVSTQLSEKGNNFYTMANRNTQNDVFTREELYSVTGIKSNLIPLPLDQIEAYLQINRKKRNSFIVKLDNKRDSNTP